MEGGAKTSYLPMTPDFTREFPLAWGQFVEWLFDKRSLYYEPADYVLYLLTRLKGILQADSFWGLYKD